MWDRLNAGVRKIERKKLVGWKLLTSFEDVLFEVNSATFTRANGLRNNGETATKAIAVNEATRKDLGRSKQASALPCG